MNRSDWLKQQRRETEERYDTLWAPLYGEKYGRYANATHQRFIQTFLSLLPQHSYILDAACGAGRYLSTIIEKGHTVIGIDQSQGMLSRAKARFPDIQVEKVGLQEMRYQEVFDGVFCMDAMENVCPEDWPLVLSNFYRSLKSKGHLYFTVEIADENEIKTAFLRNQQLGLPVLYGEWPDEEVYHYYPTAQQVKEWIRQAGFDLVEEGDGDSYRHLIARKA
jgi:cyclopropane fatty-acyl-phospholipid synthase-like methyltransferase